MLALKATILGLVVVLSAVSLRYRNVVQRASRMSIAAVTADQVLSNYQSDAKELNRILRSIPLQDYRMVGDTVLSRGVFNSVKRSRKQLVFVMSSLCKICTSTLPLLDSIERRNPGTVVGISFGDSKTKLETYANTHQLRFPIVVAPTGELARRLPKHATPVFIALDSSSITTLEIGYTGSSAARLRALYNLNATQKAVGQL